MPKWIWYVAGGIAAFWLIKKVMANRASVNNTAQTIDNNTYTSDGSPVYDSTTPTADEYLPDEYDTDFTDADY